MSHEYPLPQQDYKVLVRCYTYNHEKYIEETLKGFVMQKTDFPFVAVVVDDASTDGTADIIRKYADEYPDIIKAVCLKENHYSQKKKKGPYIQPWRKRCEYEAICEGDDYWIDPLKLQKQVDFLDQHPDYGLCHTAFLNSQNHKISKKFIEREDDNYLTSLLNGDYGIGTLTVMYRTDLFFKLPKHHLSQGFLHGDMPLWIEFAACSKIKYLSDCTSVYRILPESASHSKNLERELAFHQSCVDCRVFYANLYHIPIDLSAQRTYMASMKTAFVHNNPKVAATIWEKAGNENLRNWKMCLFYWGTKYPLIGKFIKNYYYKTS